MYVSVYLSMNRYDNFLSLVQNMKDDFDRFFNKNNKTAGSRLRKGLLDLRKICQDLRMEIQSIKNTDSVTTKTKNAVANKNTSTQFKATKATISKSTDVKKTDVKKNTKKK